MTITFDKFPPGTIVTDNALRSIGIDPDSPQMIRRLQAEIIFQAIQLVAADRLIESLKFEIAELHRAESKRLANEVIRGGFVKVAK